MRTRSLHGLQLGSASTLKSLQKQFEELKKVQAQHYKIIHDLAANAHLALGAREYMAVGDALLGIINMVKP